MRHSNELYAHFKAVEDRALLGRSASGRCILLVQKYRIRKRGITGRETGKISGFYRDTCFKKTPPEQFSQKNVIETLLLLQHVKKKKVLLSNYTFIVLHGIMAMAYTVTQQLDSPLLPFYCFLSLVIQENKGSKQRKSIGKGEISWFGIIGFPMPCYRFFWLSP